MINDIADPSAVFDAGALSDLTGDPDDHAIAREFASRYRGLLPARVRRIAAALAADDLDDALDAVRSLKVSSAMVGTHELAGIASRIEESLRQGDLAQAVVVETTLAGAVERADRALAAFLGA